MPLTWFITGCSSGFGESFVRQLRDAGDNVVASGRNAETKLAHLKDTGATILDLDTTSPLDVVETKVQQAWDAYPGGIDVVVNNAGNIISGFVEETTYVTLYQHIESQARQFSNLSLIGNKILKARPVPTSMGHSMSLARFYPSCARRVAVLSCSSAPSAHGLTSPVLLLTALQKLRWKVCTTLWSEVDFITNKAM